MLGATNLDSFEALDETLELGPDSTASAVLPGGPEFLELTAERPS